MNKNFGPKLHKFCSIDARKVIDVYEVTDIFDLETSLNRAYSKNINFMAKKKGIAAAIAMAKNGFFKDIPIRVNIDFNDKNIKRVYNLLTNMYLDKDFQYEDFNAIIDISGFDSVTILKTTENLKVKNLWYLRKVLLLNNNRSDYSIVNEIEIKDIKQKGNLININFLNEYTK